MASCEMEVLKHMERFEKKYDVEIEDLNNFLVTMFEAMKYQAIYEIVRKHSKNLPWEFIAEYMSLDDYDPEETEHDFELPGLAKFYREKYCKKEEVKK